MARFTCGNLGIHLKSLTSSVIRPKAPLGRAPTDADKKLVGRWLDQLPQTELDSTEEEPDLRTDFLVFATQELGEINKDDIGALIRAQRSVMGQRFAEAVRECATGERGAGARGKGL